ncbi:MAG: AbrB/MazE/SpoVT family DNA-binding domain-containing protein [archaeon]
MEVGIVNISTKGQIVIPKNIREKMSIKKDEQLIIMSDNGEIIMRPVKNVFNISRNKSAFAEEFIRAMKHDKILSEMEAGKELNAIDVL